MAFGTALTGLNAASEALNVTGNNIANAGTTGFKKSRAEFGDIYSQAYGGIANQAIGNGVQLEDVAQQFGQGTMKNTGNSMDLALSGNGFFVFSNNGSQVFSRAGALQVNQNGYVVNAKGEKLQVYAPITATGTNPTFNQGSLSDLQLNTGLGAPSATQKVNAQLNLDAQAQANTSSPGTITPSNPNSYTYSTPVTVYDSLGTSHTATMYFQKDATNTTTGQTNWTVLTQVDGNTVTSSPTTLTFNSNGTLVTPSNGQVAVGPYAPGNGAGAMHFTLNLSGTTMYGNTSTVNSLTQNGYTTGSLSGLNVSNTGVVSARYTNGQSQALGQVALANFTNPQGLQPIGNTAWAQTFSSGTPAFGVPGNGTFGQVQSGSLENSNVNLAKQLVSLITEQRNYQANAKVITTANAITQTIIQIP